jgi:hypothetical protein
LYGACAVCAEAGTAMLKASTAAAEVPIKRLNTIDAFSTVNPSLIGTTRPPTQDRANRRELGEIFSSIQDANCELWELCEFPVE